MRDHDVETIRTASGADFSDCDAYRYRLWRVWDRSRARLVVVGLNPSTADAERDDPTIRRCIRFARDLRMGGLVMLNLFAYRSTNPSGLYDAIDPVGPDNDAYIARECDLAGLVVAAWGAHPAAQRLPGVLCGGDGSRAGQVLRRIGRQVFALGLTKDGHPRHPLYLPASSRPVPFAVPSLLTSDAPADV